MRQRTAAGPAVLLIISAVVLLTPFGTLRAGPPFLTDDPEPLDFRHWEFYLASQDFFTAGGATGTAPHVETNYGATSRIMLHVIVPLAYAKSAGSALQAGPGDIELGLKYRFVKESRSLPQIGTFPHAQLPVGSSRRGLGSGRLQVFLPVWLQKSWGAWTTYGGGGYWIHPGTGNRNYWMFGWTLTRDLSKSLTAGLELVRNTPSEIGGRGETAVNFGALVSIRRDQLIIFSGGHDLRGPNRFFMYVAYYRTWGPAEAGGQGK